MEYTISTIAPIFIFPFMAFVVNAFFGRKLPRQGDWLSVGAIFASFLYTLRIFGDFIFNKFSTDYYVHKVFNWIDLSYGDQFFKIDLGIYIDNMTAIMLLMVTGVATLIHLFSTWYMKGDERYGKFFVYLSLFTSAMLGLVLADNLLLLFVFWEIMGFCSYSLIGFYYEKEEAGNASLKAFMTTRIGDVFLLLGILGIWSVVGNVNYVDIYAAISQGLFEGHTVMGISLASFAAFCVFMGTVGKSAQVPLQVWLPDAMMGPTPCSALIHAATMVAAGVYLSLRMYPLMELGEVTHIIAYVGAITAFLAATIALVQTDIKAVLAFSTISQLGYMVLGIGVGSYNAAFMHLITHAVFKACLFLSAGSVIHSTHTQEMPEMGGLRKKLPITFLAMLLCTLAIAGIPIFSGFVSKDRILGDALYWGLYAGQNKVHFIVPMLGFGGAFLTAFYMFRMMFLTFFGEPKDKEVYEHCHHEHFEFNRTLPLIILAALTLGVFYSGSLTGQGEIKIFPRAAQEWFKILVAAPEVKNFESYTKEKFDFADTREEKVWEKAHYHHQSGYAGVNPDNEEGIHHAHINGAVASVIIAFSGVLLAFFLYIRRLMSPDFFVNMLKPLHRLTTHRYYFDDFYIGILLKKGLLVFNNALAFLDMGIYDRIAIDGWAKVNNWIYRASKWFDDVIVDSIAVDGTGTAVNLFNLVLRVLQSGKIQFYFVVLIVVLSGYIWSLNFIS
ncbi:MAG: NADH-quinone oxidoreductase subunit L [Bacteriovoracaceae bacterium]|nr:NADH-quinone oxidoreductase subunit L [Bacteriovoracaceae bacterium]